MDKTGFYATKELIQNWTESRSLLRQAIQILGFQAITMDVYRLGRYPGGLVVAFWLKGVAMETFDREVRDMIPRMTDFLDGDEDYLIPVPDVDLKLGPDWACWEHQERLVFARRNWHE